MAYGRLDSTKKLKKFHNSGPTYQLQPSNYETSASYFQLSNLEIFYGYYKTMHSKVKLHATFNEYDSELTTFLYKLESTDNRKMVRLVSVVRTQHHICRSTLHVDWVNFRTKGKEPLRQ